MCTVIEKGYISGLLVYPVPCNAVKIVYGRQKQTVEMN